MKIDEKKEVIKVIHYKEVHNFFKSIECEEKLEKDLICHICKKKITEQNFKATIRWMGKLLFCCDKHECYRVFTETIRK